MSSITPPKPTSYGPAYLSGGGVQPTSSTSPGAQLNPGYTVRDLVKDGPYQDILTYMVDRFGSHVEEDDREVLVDKYLNNMRGFKGGNSVRAINEVAYLSSLEDNELPVAGKAYEIFENLPGIFDEKNDWGTTLEGVKDYARSAILDPVNVVGGVIGKGVAAGGFKSTAAGANLLARKAYQKTLTKHLAKGAVVEEAESTALKVANRVMQGAARKTIIEAEKRAIARQQVVGGVKNELLKKIATRGNLVEAGVVGTVDAISAGATDWAYQTALYETGVTEDRSATQSGVTALATLAATGALVSLSGLLKRSGDVAGPDIRDLNTSRKGARLSTIATQIKQAAAKPNVNKPASEGKWLTDVANGKELGDLDTNFWVTLVLGDQDNGIKGMTSTLKEQNFAWIPRNDDDTISNYIGDVIKGADPEDFKTFIKEFEEISPNIMSELKGMTQEKIGDTFKLKVRQAGVINNMASQASKELGVERFNLTKGDMLNFLREDSGGKVTAQIEAGANKLVDRTIPRTQNQLIRLLVANLSTSQLNMIGWSVASSMDTATDLVTAAIQAPYRFATGNKAGVKDALLTARSAITKLQNIVDPNMSYDEFVKYAASRPKALREVTSVLPGGVENSKALKDSLDLDSPLWSMQLDEAVDFIQWTQLGTAQDSLSKSIEFMTALDTGIRKKYGVSHKEFFQRPDYWKEMSTLDFQKIEQRAVVTTIDNIFSRSYGKTGGHLGEVADIIEKVRNVPGLGILMPFGRFFNNTVAFMSDYGGLSLAMRTVGLNKNSTEETSRLLARTAVGWATIAALVPREMEFIDKGLTWDEQTQLGDVTGAITTEKYNFPYSFLKGMARIVAHKQRGEEVPEAAFEDMNNTFLLESFTRGFTDAFGSGGEAFQQIVTGEEPITDVLSGVAKKVGAQYASSATRFMEPANIALGIAQGRDRVVPDRRQGSENYNQAVRYFDEFINIFDPDSKNEQRYVASRGALRPQDSRMISPVREVKTTNISRLAALAGVKEWDPQITEIGAKAAQSSNRYARYYSRVNEAAAGELLNDPYFKEADQRTKRDLAVSLFRNNKKIVKDYMEADLSAGDADLKRIIDIQNKWKESDIAREKKKLGFSGMDLEDMNTEQLLLLQTSLDFEKELRLLR